MKIHRRQVLQFAAAGATLSALPRIASAQTYPARPVRIIVGFPAGGPTDIMARIIAQSLSAKFRQPFVVENQSGAASNVATEAVTRAPSDGYTLILVTPANTINATLYHTQFNFLHDIAPVAGLGRNPLVMEVNPSVPAKTVPEFIAYAKSNPGKVNMASAGTGTTDHIAGELFNMMAGLHMLHVPYRGAAPAIMDVISGQDQVLFDSISSSLQYIKAGKLRALAVTTANRSELLPNVPPVSTFLPGYEVSFYTGLGAPKNTPPQIIDTLNETINAALADSQVKARLAALGVTPMPMKPAEFGKFLADETERWAKVVKFSGAKVQ